MKNIAPFTPEEIKDIVNDEADRMNPEATADMVIEIINEVREELKDFSPAEKLAYISRQAYMAGFSKSLLVFNQTIKEITEENGKSEYAGRE